MKVCKKCSKEKDLEQFHRNSKSSDGRVEVCKECRSAAGAEYYKEYLSLGKKKPRSRQYAIAEGMHRCSDCKKVKLLAEFPGGKKYSYCKICHNKRGKKYLKEKWGGGRHYHLLGRYGITAEEAAELLKNPCGICGKTSENIDHDHDTGKVRGVLCGLCNRALGQFLDNIELLKKAVAYMERAPLIDSRPPSRKLKDRVVIPQIDSDAVVA